MFCSFFFFKQKTAYEMRISDWSSDVCSSDLISKVGKRLHFFATCMVALGTLISATWIIAANSWMHTPVGFAINARGQFVPAGSWLPIIFNPSFPYRLVHTVKIGRAHV